MKRRIIDILLVTLGSFIAAVGYNSLLVKNNIASGGVGGLAISLNALFGWNNANFVLATTIPLLILCWFFLGREVLLKTFYGSFMEIPQLGELELSHKFSTNIRHSH